MSNKELEQLEQALIHYQAEVAKIEGTTKLAKRLTDILDTEVRVDQKKQQSMVGVVERNKARVGQTEEYDALTDGYKMIDAALNSILNATIRGVNDLDRHSSQYKQLSQLAKNCFIEAGYEVEHPIFDIPVENTTAVESEGPLATLVQKVKDDVLKSAKQGSPKIQETQELIADLKGIENKEDNQQQAVKMIEETIKAMPVKAFFESESKVVTKLKQVRNEFAIEFNLEFDPNVKPEGAKRHRNVDKVLAVGEANFKKLEQKTKQVVDAVHLEPVYKQAVQALADKVFELATDERYTEEQRVVIQQFHNDLDSAIAEKTTNKMHEAVQAAFTKHEASLNKIEPDFTFKIKSWWNGIAEKSGLSDKWKFDIRAADIKQDIGFTPEQTNVETLTSDDIRDTFVKK